MCVEGRNEPEEVALGLIMEGLACYSRWFGLEPIAKGKILKVFKQ